MFVRLGGCVSLRLPNDRAAGQNVLGKSSAKAEVYAMSGCAALILSIISSGEETPQLQVPLQTDTDSQARQAMSKCNMATGVQSRHNTYIRCQKRCNHVVVF